MVPTNDGLLRSLRAARVFTHISVLLLLTHSCGGQSNLICPSQPVVALAGEDVTLPCRLDPPISASLRAVEWTRPGLDPEYVHVHQDGRLVYQSQNPQFKYRTALFVDQLINGNVSLKLSRVKLSDAGRYRCFIPTLWKEAFLQVSVVSDDSFMVSSGCAASTTFSVLFGFMFVSAVGFIVWKWRQQKSETRTQNNKSQDEETTGASNNTELQSLMKGKVSKEQLMAENRKMKELMRELKKELKNELERQKEKIIEQEQKAGKQAEENDKEVKSVEKEVREKEGDITFNRGLGYLKLRETITQNNWILEERRKELQTLHMNTDTLIQRTYNKINKITGDKEEKKDQTREPHEANKETAVVTKTEKIDSEETEKKNETEQQ